MTLRIGMDGSVTVMLTTKSIKYLSSSNLHISVTVVTLTGSVITTASLAGSVITTASLAGSVITTAFEFTTAFEIGRLLSLQLP